MFTEFKRNGQSSLMLLQKKINSGGQCCECLILLQNGINVYL